MFLNNIYHLMNEYNKHIRKPIIKYFFKYTHKNIFMCFLYVFLMGVINVYYYVYYYGCN